VGPRGSGKWQRISWEQANAEIADAMLDAITQHGSDRIIWDLGPLYTEGTMAGAHQRLSVLLDSTNLDMNSEIGDAHRGVAETFGKISFERSADDYCYSDLILIWGSNPLYSQIPNAHFLMEARYKGAQLVCIAPDYSPSSVHTDLFVPVEPGGDAALALTPPWPSASPTCSSRKIGSTATSSPSRRTCRCWCARTHGSSCGAPT
jgi:anaerobic selenocysteine-containing dehydrogenase